MPHRQTVNRATGRPDPGDIIDACVTPLAILDHHLHVQHANPAFCALFDFEPLAGDSLHIADHVAEFEDDDALLDGLEAAAGQDDPVVDYPLQLTDRQPGRCEVRVYARKIEGDAPEKTRLLVEARAACGTAAWHPAESRQPSTAGAKAALSIDKQGIVENCNRLAGHMLGYDEDDACGLPLDALFDHTADGAAIRALERFAGPGEPGGCERRWIAKRRDGTRFPVEVDARGDQGGESFMLRLRQMSGFENDERRVLDISMEEQRRFAHELEDNMLQSIAGIRLLIDEIRQQHESGTLDEKLMAWLSHAAVEAGRRTRKITKDVTRTIREGEFIDNVVKMARRMADYSGTSVEIDDHSDRQPRDAWIEANLLRVVRTATLVAIRDAGAARITTGDNGTVFTVKVLSAASDRGRGDTADERMDFAIMACHAELCGATLHIERRRGAGTATIVSVPLGSENAA